MGSLITQYDCCLKSVRLRLSFTPVKLQQKQKNYNYVTAHKYCKFAITFQSNWILEIFIFSIVSSPLNPFRCLSTFGYIWSVMEPRPRVASSTIAFNLEVNCVPVSRTEWKASKRQIYGNHLSKVILISDLTKHAFTALFLFPKICAWGLRRDRSEMK